MDYGTFDRKEPDTNPPGVREVNLSDTVTISKKEYDSLVRRSNWLECLEDAGVDNWQGIEFAIDFKYERYGDD
jgi:hypothetical protein